MIPDFKRAITEAGKVLKTIRPAGRISAEAALGVGVHAQKCDGLRVGHAATGSFASDLAK